MYSWADPNYALVHASIVECHRNLREGLEEEGKAETTGEDNLRTMELVFASIKAPVPEMWSASNRPKRRDAAAGATAVGNAVAATSP